MENNVEEENYLQNQVNNLVTTKEMKETEEQMWARKNGRKIMRRREEWGDELNKTKQHHQLRSAEKFHVCRSCTAVVAVHPKWSQINFRSITLHRARLPRLASHSSLHETQQSPVVLVISLRNNQKPRSITIQPPSSHPEATQQRTANEEPGMSWNKR